MTALAPETITATGLVVRPAAPPVCREPGGPTNFTEDRALSPPTLPWCCKAARDDAGLLPHTVLSAVEDPGQRPFPSSRGRSHTSSSLRIALEASRRRAISSMWPSANQNAGQSRASVLAAVSLSLLSGIGGLCVERSGQAVIRPDSPAMMLLPL